MNERDIELNNNLIKESKCWRTWCYVVLLLIGYISTLIFIYNVIKVTY